VTLPLGRSQRVRATIVGAAGLEAAGRDGQPPSTYCVCQVQGRPQIGFKSDLVSSSFEPLWNEPCELDCPSGEALEFVVMRKSVWPHPDTQLGSVVVSAEEFQAQGFNGARPLAGAPGATLQVCVKPLGRPAVAASPTAASPSTISFGGAAVRSPAARSEPLRGPPAHPTGPLRLRILVRAARGLVVASGGGARRESLYCVCGVVGRPAAVAQTRVAGGAGDPVWNAELELEYSAGDALEFAVVDMLAQPDRTSLEHPASPLLASLRGSVVGSTTLHAERFLPYGYDSEMTLASQGRGICGLLRVRIAADGYDAKATRDSHFGLGSAPRSPLSTATPASCASPLSLPAGRIAGGLSPMGRAISWQSLEARRDFGHLSPSSPTFSPTARIAGGTSPVTGPPIYGQSLEARSKQSAFFPSRYAVDGRAGAPYHRAASPLPAHSLAGRSAAPKSYAAAPSQYYGVMVR